MSSKIQQALAKATEVEPKKDETITDQSYMKRLALAVGELSDKDWDKLDGDQQDWTNAAADAINAKQDVPVYPDFVKPQAEDPAPRRRRAAADDGGEAAASATYVPKKGDKVKATTKRGKTYEGVVVDPDDAGELVINDGTEELGIKLEGLTIEQVVEDPQPTSRRRKAAEEPETPPEPEVSDTVEIKTKRGKIVVGNVVEIDDKIVVIKGAAGDEEEYDIDRLESIVVKVKNAGKSSGKADDAKAGSGKKDEPEAGKRTKTTKDDNGGVSVTTRARELMVENLDADKDKIIAMLKKEGLEFKENTIQLIYGDVHKLIGMLKARKMLK